MNGKAMFKTNQSSKRILTIDGGGIRGIIAIEILAKIESILKDELHDKNLVLCDYFDFFGGTSTGAIIAAALACRWSVDTLREFYINDGEKMFDAANIFARFRYKYDDDNLAEMLKSVFKDFPTLGSVADALLLMVMRNATTDSPWPICNNPTAKYNLPERRNPPNCDCNLDFPLWQLIRASTAAPTFFPPEKIRMGDWQFLFVDGGLTCYNNPSFQAFKMATLGPYNINWNTGEKEMLLISVGTGLQTDADLKLASKDMNIIYNASHIPSIMISAAQIEQDLLCRMFGKCLVGDPIDREIGDLIGVPGPTQSRLFTYARYNVELTTNGFTSIGITDIDPEHVQKMDSVKHICEMQAIGKAIAEKRVTKEHFKEFL
jgi:hypothetical protein